MERRLSRLRELNVLLKLAVASEGLKKSDEERTR